jgi:hypothetical protein
MLGPLRDHNIEVYLQVVVGGLYILAIRLGCPVYPIHTVFWHHILADSTGVVHVQDV